MTKKEHFRSHLALCLEMNPTLSVSSFFAYRFEELLILLVCDILLLSRPDGHVVVQCVPRPHIHLTNVTRERERERERGVRAKNKEPGTSQKNKKPAKNQAVTLIIITELL